MRIFKRKTTRLRENEDRARLEQAEDDLRELKRRGIHAIRSLDERDSRNHWRESIEQMIQGAV